MTLYMTVEVYFWAKHWLIFTLVALKTSLGISHMWEIFKAIIPKHLYELPFNFCSTRKAMKLQKDTRFTQCRTISKGQRGDQTQGQSLKPGFPLPCKELNPKSIVESPPTTYFLNYGINEKIHLFVDRLPVKMLACVVINFNLHSAFYSTVWWAFVNPTAPYTPKTYLFPSLKSVIKILKEEIVLFTLDSWLECCIYALEFLGL